MLRWGRPPHIHHLASILSNQLINIGRIDPDRRSAGPMLLRDVTMETALTPTRSPWGVRGAFKLPVSSPPPGGHHWTSQSRRRDTTGQTVSVSGTRQLSPRFPPGLHVPPTPQRTASCNPFSPLRVRWPPRPSLRVPAAGGRHVPVGAGPPLLSREGSAVGCSLGEAVRLPGF